MRRVGVGWWCGKECYDDKKGYRGAAWLGSFPYCNVFVGRSLAVKELLACFPILQIKDDLLWGPRGATCESPRLLWIHGGSWEYGSPDTLSYGQLASKLAGLSGAVVMVPDYPLAPLGTYSIIMGAALDALRWLAEAPLKELGLNCPPGSAPLLVGGDSAGGGTAVSLHPGKL